MSDIGIRDFYVVDVTGKTITVSVNYLKYQKTNLTSGTGQGSTGGGAHTHPLTEVGAEVDYDAIGAEAIQFFLIYNVV